ncbi:MAG: septum site-determining protein MinC [Desulfobulbaceae bacterium]|nr:septum site-determining protein MinC [Desulfobulbaceae bacterium]
MHDMDQPKPHFMHPAHSPSPQDAIELQGSALTVVVLHLKNSDPRILYPQLEDLIDEAGSFLASAPVLIDVTALDTDAQDMLDFSYLLRYLRGAELMPVGVQGAADSQKDRISQAGLLAVATVKKEGYQETKPAVQSGQSQAKKQPAPQAAPRQEPVAPAEPPPPRNETAQHRQTRAAAPAAIAPVVITRPVRSGQQVSAPHGDLIVLASVNAGSELFAAGNIHVYGALRGRALAGVNGDTEARVFALQGNPELVAIAGDYVVNEELPRGVINQSFAVYWTESGLRFQVLGSFYF